TPITIDQNQAAGNGQLNRTNDGSALIFGGNMLVPGSASEANFGSADRNWAIVTAGGSVSIASASESGTTATITTVAGPGFATGELVRVSAVGTWGYNGTFTITGTPSSNTFTYTAGSSGLATDTGGGTATAGVATISSASESGNTVTITTSASHGFSTG